MLHSFGQMIRKALNGLSKQEILQANGRAFNEPKVTDLANGQYADKTREDIFGTGYCVASLEAALWCFHQTDSFETAVLAAANLGDDADTTAAIVGQIAGAHYGVGGIPESWLDRLYMRKDIELIANALFTAAKADCD
jgi:ADP-ribosyl-[dinitrogen reductase] hydrolase